MDDEDLNQEIKAISEANKVNATIQKQNESRKKEDIKKKEEEKMHRINDDFIPLKDDPKFKNQIELIDIQKDLNRITQYEMKDNLPNKNKFVEIQHDDVINFKEEAVLNFFKKINFILSEDSKKRLNLLYFCIKHGFHILIPGPTGTGKTYLSEAICNLLGKNMIKFNCSENTKFPNLKFTCQGDKDKFAGIKYVIYKK